MTRMAVHSRLKVVQPPDGISGDLRLKVLYKGNAGPWKGAVGC